MKKNVGFSMKILQITPYFLPHTGGVEQYVFNLSNYLVKQGHQVDVITSNSPPGLKTEKMKGITITRLPCYGELLRNPITPDSLFSIKDFNNFDIIHIHNIYAFSSVFAGIKKSQIKTPVLLTHHGRLKFGSFFKDTIVHLYEASIGKKIVKNINCSVALTAVDADFLASLGMKRDRIQIIPNGIDVSAFENSHAVDTAILRESFGLRNKFVLLYVGEITYRKGIKHLIGAMSEIRNHISDKDIALLIVGSGPELESMQGLVKKMNLEKYISFRGRVPFSELVEYYRIANVFILPSLSEGMPTAILEALFFNVPVITSDIPALKESFSDLALFVNPENEREIAEQVLKLVNQRYSDTSNPDTRSYVESHYSWSVLSKKYEKIYQKIHQGNY
jgi:glycosyltransferase involved in cell wall biosynthesis